MILEKIYKHYKNKTLSTKIIFKLFIFIRKPLNYINNKLNNINEKIKVKEKIIPKINVDNFKFNEFKKFNIKNKIQPNVKTIAFYLPQFHPFKENDEFWGKGFTEWTNVTKAQPNFYNHNQPRLPIHLGFYDLRLIQNIEEQIKLANNYGIYGFCIYYYWFSGRKVMDIPLNLVFNNKHLQINYCLSWANENWTRTWDGESNNVLLSQKYSDEDPGNFINDISIYFNDERYIKIHDKPVLLIYNAAQIPNLKNVIIKWRETAKKLGFKDLHLIATRTFYFNNSEKYNFDDIVDFPPHNPDNIPIHGFVNDLGINNTNFNGVVFDYNSLISSKIKTYKNSNFLKTAMLGFDNTARKQNSPFIFHDFSPFRFSQWLSNIIIHTLKNDKIKNKFIFINAWNEWAEGTYLEPDIKNGFSNLEVCHHFLSKTSNNLLPYYYTKKFKKNNDIAIIFHLFYLDCLEIFYKYIDKLNYKFDLYITICIDVVDIEIINKLKNKYPEINILIVENRGRDILPFIELFKHIFEFNYNFICKIHSKKTLYRNDGNILFENLLNSLLNNDIVKDILENNNNNGLFIPEKFALKLNQNISSGNCLAGNKENVYKIANLLKIQVNEEEYFPAGTMFWANPNAIKQILKLDENLFNYEDGLLDGDIPHSIERIFGLICKNNKFDIKII